MTIGGSLNISLSNNPVFLGGHFVRVEPLEVICLCGLRCYPRIICRVWHLFFANVLLSRLIYIARCGLSSLNVSPGETKLEIFPWTSTDSKQKMRPTMHGGDAVLFCSVLSDLLWFAMLAERHGPSYSFPVINPIETHSILFPSILLPSHDNSNFR